MVCHPSRTFPPWEPEQEPQNRLSLLLTAKPYHFLPLNHDPLLLYWLGRGWWCLGFMHVLLLCMSKVCLLLMLLPWFGGLYVCPVAHPWPLMVQTVFWFLTPYGLLLSKVGSWLIVGFSFLNLFFVPFVVLLPFLPHYSTILVVVLFDPCLLGLFWASCMFFFQ